MESSQKISEAEVDKLSRLIHKSSSNKTSKMTSFIHNLFLEANKKKEAR